MSLRIGVLTNIVSPYRVPVFNALAKTAGVDFEVIFLGKNERRRSWKVLLEQLQFRYSFLPGFEVNLGSYGGFVNWGVRKFLEQNSFDVLVCGGYNHLAAFSALFYARRIGTRFVLWCESNQRDQRLNWRFISYVKAGFIRRCDAFLVPGWASAKYLRSLGVDEGLIFSAPNAVDNDHFERCSKLAKGRLSEMKAKRGYPHTILLYVGRLEESKGVYDLIGLSETLEDKDNVGVVLVGDGPAGAKLKQYCEERGLKNVYFEGFVQQDDLPIYYALADVFVFPSYSDPWGLVINEAMACGLPIISSDAPGAVDDLVRDGENGFVYPAGNQEMLSRCTKRLLRGPELREKMGRRSSEIIREYAPEKCADGFIAAVQGVMGLTDHRV